jgi:hypothetical protein
MHRARPSGETEGIGKRVGRERGSATVGGTTSRGAEVIEDAAGDAGLGDEGEQVLRGAIGAADAGKAALEDAAVEIPRDDPAEEAAPEAVANLTVLRGLEYLGAVPAGGETTTPKPANADRIACRRPRCAPDSPRQPPAPSASYPRFGASQRSASWSGILR